MGCFFLDFNNFDTIDSAETISSGAWMAALGVCILYLVELKF